MQSVPLAAIHFDAGDVDSLLCDIAQSLGREGQIVRGALQYRGAVTGECHCADMDLTTIGTGRTFRISQPLGNGSHGCRLHPGALAQCSEFLMRDLSRGADLLILNRFGRGESEGRGFRDLITFALERGTLVLTAVRPAYAASWAEFSAELGCDLPLQRRSVLDWVSNQLDLKRAA